MAIREKLAGIGMLALIVSAVARATDWGALVPDSDRLFDQRQYADGLNAH